jgi:hypothetical protein
MPDGCRTRGRAQTAGKPQNAIIGRERYPGFLALVAGIHRPDVCRVKRLFQLKDLSWLDSCDRHRNDQQAEPAFQSAGLFR